jgi:redox-sensitive bicupin YhaK (pirin superfamily)
MNDDLFLQTLLPATHDLGGFKVHRTLPHRERTCVGPFIFFDQMGPARLDPGRGIDVRPHPHINLATVTYLFAGAIDHRDSLGTFATIAPGAVNLMTAGKGITHSERSPAALRPDGPELSGIQTWLALPAAKEEVDPAFEHVAKEGLPTVEADGARARVVMGSLWDETSPVTCHSHTIYADIHLVSGGAMPIDPEADERALYVAEGEASLDGVPLAPATLYVLRPGIRATLRAAAASCCAAARPWTGRATSSGTSSLRAATASSRPRTIGRPAASLCPRTTMTNISRSPKCRRP